MFDTKEMEDKTLLERVNNSVFINSLKTGTCVYFLNKKTNNKYKLSFTKQNGYSYKINISYDIDKDDREAKLLTSKATYIVLKSVITLNIVDDKLKINAPSTFDIYE